MSYELIYAVIHVKYEFGKNWSAVSKVKSDRTKDHMVFGLYKWSLIEQQETVMVQKNDANKVQQNKTFQFRHCVMNLYWEDKKYSLQNICGRKDEGHINYQRACAHAETKHAGWETQSLKPSKALFSLNGTGIKRILVY